MPQSPQGARLDLANSIYCNIQALANFAEGQTRLIIPQPVSQLQDNPLTRCQPTTPQNNMHRPIEMIAAR